MLYCQLDSKVSDIIFQNIRLDKGPKIVVIGGGTGLSNLLLRGLKVHTSNLSYIVTVADDNTFLVDCKRLK